MRIIHPNNHEIAIINRSRSRLGHNMSSTAPDRPLMVFMAACATDSNRLDNGEIANVTHVTNMDTAAKKLPGIHFAGRYNGAKPRTAKGPTGLIHEKGGALTYTEGAQMLTKRGIPLVAEIMDESDFAVASMWLSAGWIGARNDHDTGPRYLARPNSRDREWGVYPLPFFVKNSMDGTLDGPINALRTITEPDDNQSRLLMTWQGPEEVTTYANPHVGLILRGSAVRPDGPIETILRTEIEVARARLDKEFPGRRIPIIVDASHGHAKWEGGGEMGQLAIVKALGNLILAGVPIDGVMAETYLLPGNQSGNGKVPGLSIVDRCVGESQAVDELETLNKAWLGRPERRNLLTNV